MKRVGIVACSSQKMKTAAPARELYTSALFRKSLAHAELTCDAVHIMSAFHGLIDLDRITHPYDRSLAKFSKRDRQTWGYRIADALLFRYGPPLEYEAVLYGGIAYTEPVRCALFSAKRIRVSIPLGKLQIGDRLAWLTGQLAIHPNTNKQETP